MHTLKALQEPVRTSLLNCQRDFEKLSTWLTQYCSKESGPFDSGAYLHKTTSQKPNREVINKKNSLH